MGQPRRSGLLPVRGPGKFASDLRRISIPGVDGGSGPISRTRHRAERGAQTLDSTQEMTESVQMQIDARLEETAGGSALTLGASDVTRQAVVRGLSAIEDLLPDDWVDLITADRFPALLVRLERARRLGGDARLDEAIRLVTALQEKVLGQLLEAFGARLKADDLDGADTLLQQARAVADDHPRLARATAELARAHDDRRASREGELKLERARELGGPPHEPRQLKQALKLYDDLLRRIERYPSLRPAFDVIRDERDEVERRIKEADNRESERRTAVAIGQIDDLVAALDDYGEALESGALDAHYAREQIDQIARLIGERLAPKMREFLEDTEALAANPRDAEVGLDRLREYKRLWHHLPADLRATVERREEALVELIRRRDEVLAEVDEAIGQIHRGDYVGAIRQLILQARLHEQFQIDVQRPIGIATDALAQQIRHQLDGLDLLMSDPYTDDAEFEHIAETLRGVLDRIAPVAAQTDGLAETQQKVADINQGLRRLKGRLDRFDRQFERCRAAVDQGRIGQARRLVERMGEDAPPQRKGHLTDLKVELDIAIEEDEIEARLNLLALSDRAGARQWAEAHADQPTCRRYLLESTASERLQDAWRLEREGRIAEALQIALAVQAEAPANRAEEVERLVEHLRATRRDSAEVKRRLERAEALQAQDRWAESLALLSADIELSAHQAADWRAARHRAEMALDHDRIARLGAALDEVRAAREAWQARPFPADDCLAPSPESPTPAEAAAQLAEALRQLERIPMDDGLRARLTDDAAPPEGRLLAQRLILEQRLCAAEEAIARFDFASARSRLEDVESADHPAVERVRARLARIEFGRLFGQALGGSDLAQARALLAAYPAPSADEAIMARRLVELCAAADAALVSTLAASTTSIPASGVVDGGSAEGRTAAGVVDHIRRVRLDVHRMVQAHPHCDAALAETRRRLDAGLVAAVEQLFTAWSRDLLPGGVIARIDLVARILSEGPPVTALDEQLALLQARLPDEGREFLEWIESHTRLDALSAQQLADIEARLDTLGRYVESDPQFERCRRRIRQIRTDIGRQVDARRRHEGLIKQALETLDSAVLEEACRLEQGKLVEGEQAAKLRASWQQAEPVVAELKRAMAERAFDRVERLLDRLQETGSVAHLARLDLPHPFEVGRRLPQGADGVRGILPALRDRAEQAVAARAREVEALDHAVDELHRWLRCAVAGAPPCPTEADREAFVKAVCARAYDRLGQLGQQIEALRRGSSAGTGSSLRALAARLPPRNPMELMGHVTELDRRYRADHAAVVALSQAEPSAIRSNRAGLMAVKRRWEGVEDLTALVEGMLRLVG